MKATQTLHNLGQSIWLDNITRDLLESGTLKRYTLFAREDYVEEAWRIVDPMLKKDTPVYPYEPKNWGPNEVEQVAPPGGWQNPVMRHEPSAATKAA
jgi:glucose-6-phosphate 1-dehydrogenase